MPMKIVEPFQALATSILLQAIKQRKEPLARQEVWEFFESDWFEDVCDLAKISPDLVRKKLGIVLKPRKILGARLQ